MFETVIPAAVIPANVRFDTDTETRGQMVETAYAEYPPPRGESCARLARYKRVTDHSDGEVTYYRR